MLTRRSFLISATLGLPAFARSAAGRRSGLEAQLERMERAQGGRLGVAVVDTGSGETTTHRGDERFPMCSTFKFLLAGAVLRKVDHHKESLDRALQVPARPLLSHSPLSEPHAAGSMRLVDLCRAVVVQSDNTAANLLLDTLGGPAGITQFARSIGDPITRLDRTELALNEGLAGDLRDTTSPLAMAADLRNIVLGSVLSAPSRIRLTQWLVDCETGRDRLRALLPASWRVADKTGANGTHTSNDIALLWPPGRSPILVSAFITQCVGPESKRATMLAQIGEWVMHAYA